MYTKNIPKVYRYIYQKHSQNITVHIPKVYRYIYQKHSQSIQVHTVYQKQPKVYRYIYQKHSQSIPVHTVYQKHSQSIPVHIPKVYRYILYTKNIWWSLLLAGGSWHFLLKMLCTILLFEGDKSINYTSVLISIQANSFCKKKESIFISKGPKRH